jgi:hypothetical protein
MLGVGLIGRAELFDARLDDLEPVASPLSSSRLSTSGRRKPMAAVAGEFADVQIRTTLRARSRGTMPAGRRSTWATISPWRVGQKLEQRTEAQMTPKMFGDACVSRHGVLLVKRVAKNENGDTRG